MKRTTTQLAVAAALLGVSLTAPATDLDLYVSPPSTGTADAPNVLFVVDNTANWSKAFSAERQAVHDVIANLPDGAFNIGIIMGTEEGGSNKGQSGGYVRAAIRPMTGATKTAYANMVLNWSENQDKASGGVGPLSIAEAYYYISGSAPYSGSTKTKTDYTNNTNGGTAQSNAIYRLSGNALTAYDGDRYRSPIVAGACPKNYIIYISNGPNQSNTNGDADALTKLKQAAGGGAAGEAAGREIPLSPSGSQSSPIDEWARFMKTSPYGVTTYTVDVNASDTGQGPGWSAVLKSMAGGKGSGYYSVNTADVARDLAKVLNDALSKIQSVNSVFAAVSLPASANVQGAFLNQLFVGMFRPDPDSLPRWAGNLKQYKLGDMQDLVDGDGTPAINTETGFVTECARSFWTPSKSTPDTYWTLDPKGKCIPTGANPQLYAVSNTPDGNIVEKGAMAHMLRNATVGNRTVHTCSSVFSSCTALETFNDANITPSELGLDVLDLTQRTELVQWAQGKNIDSELSMANTVMRASAHGDVVHSNPLALSYNNNADVVVFYGSNDGMLRAVNGNRTANYGGVNGTIPAGGELWAFMPPEFYKNIKRLRENNTLVKISAPVIPPPVVAGAPVRASAAKPFGIDGPISAYRDGANTWIYTAMRRGGRAVYAFDVSNPLLPTLKWKKGCPVEDSDDGCTGAAVTGPLGVVVTPAATLNMTGIGQTWSIPRPLRIKNDNGAAPLIVMGGGYDTCEDTDIHTCSSSTKGNKVYVLDAGNGAVQAVLNTDRGVVADVRFVPDAEGYAKFGYVADLGGNIYRITIKALAPASWTIAKIASLGCDTTAACTYNRKFMFAPSVIPEGNDVYSIYLGSGDREKPLGSAYFPGKTAVANYFFKIKDKPEDATWMQAESANCGGSELVCMASLGSAGSTVSGVCGGTAPLDGKGWLLGLRDGEQVVTPPATRFGVTTFSTHIPAVRREGSCGNLGTVYVYNLAIANAAAVPGTTCGDVVTGGGLPPPPEKMDVCWDADCRIKKSVCIGCSTDSPIQGERNEPPASALGANGKRRVYWYIQK